MFDWLLSLFRKPHVQGPPPRGGSGVKPRPRQCKNCGRPLRGLNDAPEIPVHVDTDSRWCGVAADGLPRTDGPTPVHWAEWPGEDLSDLNWLLKRIQNEDLDQPMVLCGFPLMKPDGTPLTKRDIFEAEAKISEGNP